jgi:DNA-binding NtrC family response regulator
VAEQLKKILVVDDEENTRIALKRLLSREGYDVQTAANGLEALHSLRSCPAELIITDLNMPEMNGLAFLRELNRDYPSSNVIMITAFGEVESYLEALNLGAFEYLNKPLRLEELRKVMGKMFPAPSDERRKTDEAF